MACDPSTLIADARPFLFLTEDQRAIISVSLLDEILEAGTISPGAGSFRITEISDVRITETGDFRIVE